MEKVFDTTDFEGRLNLDGFTNIEKGFTSKEFATKYPSEDFLVFEKSQIENYKQNVLRAVQEDRLQKGGNPFTSEKEDILEKAKQELGQLHKVRINDGPGLVREVYVMEKARKWNIGDTREMNGKKYVLKPAKSGTGRLSWIVVKDDEKTEKKSSPGNESEEDAKRMMDATAELSRKVGTEEQYRGTAKAPSSEHVELADAMLAMLNFGAEAAKKIGKDVMEITAEDVANAYTKRELNNARDRYYGKGYELINRDWKVGETVKVEGREEEGVIVKLPSNSTGFYSIDFGNGNRYGIEEHRIIKRTKKAKPKSSEDDQKISLIEKLIKQGFSPEEAKEKVEGKKEGSKDVPVRKNKFDVKVGDTIGNTVRGFNFEVLKINNTGLHPLQVKNKNTGEVINVSKENMYLSSSDFKKEEVNNQKKSDSKEKNNIKKSFDSENEDTLEKGVLDSFRYGQSKIDFKKKGSDIKTKLIIKQQELLNCIEKEQEHIAELEKDFIRLPTQNPDLWGERKTLKVNYKVFAWNQTYFAPEDAQTSMSIIGNNGEDCQACESKEEAEMNSKYNSCVYKIIDCMMDLRLIDLYLDSFEDNKDYTLTTEQMLELGF